MKIIYNGKVNNKFDYKYQVLANIQSYLLDCFKRQKTDNYIQQHKGKCLTLTANIRDCCDSYKNLSKSDQEKLDTTFNAQFSLLKGIHLDFEYKDDLTKPPSYMRPKVLRRYYKVSGKTFSQSPLN